MQQTLIRSLRRAALLAIAVAPAARAQERALFTWNGRVDDDVHVMVHSAAISSELVSGAQTRNPRVVHVSPLPRRDGTVRIEQLAGRGTVSVLQQPSASNGYTAIIDVKDTDSGPDTYRFSAYFTPSTVSGGDVLNATGALTTSGALSPGQPVLRWSGNVDRDIAITIRRGRVRTSTLAGAEPKNVQASLAAGGLPEQDAQLTLSQREGRGTVTITQQPSAANNYTAIIRVRDSRPGFGYFDFDIIWQ